MVESRDVIRERMLANLNTKYDKLPGTFAWETYQADAIEKENQGILLDNGLDQAFAGTADLEHLKVMAFEDRGIVYKDATFAEGPVKMAGAVGAIVNIGDLVSNDLAQYAATEKVVLGSTGEAIINVKCTTAGSIGNAPIGAIKSFPKTLTGINSVTNEAAFSNGYEEEGRDSLLKRYYESVQRPGTSGNNDHYVEWANSVDGVGAVKVKPLWNGGGTVKVVILDTNKKPATQQLITNTKAYIETQRPIGASVTVVTATELSINIFSKITLKTGYSLDQAKEDIKKNIEAYFKESAFVDQNIYYAKIGNLIFNSVGVSNVDYSTFTINGAKNDIILVDTNSETQIAKLGTLTITV